MLTARGIVEGRRRGGSWKVGGAGVRGGSWNVGGAGVRGGSWKVDGAGVRGGSWKVGGAGVRGGSWKVDGGVCAERVIRYENHVSVWGFKSSPGSAFWRQGAEGSFAMCPACVVGLSRPRNTYKYSNCLNWTI